MSDHNLPSGSAFLIQEVGSETIFTPEQFTDEQKMFADTADKFLTEEVLAQNEALEHPDADHSTMVNLLRKAGEIGLLMIDVPEEYGGLGLDKTTSMLCQEKMSQHGSFAVSWSAHVGIGSLPLVFFGNDAQKKKWLPALATGEKLAAYALTEPGSGSDALAAKTTAVLNEEGTHYVLNGSKMWITNAGFADLFTVFCQVDGNKFTAFLVESDREGLSTGAEEHKMGIKGSSTRALVLDNVKVPVENLLGEVGRGHKIAFNILNIGRFKLGVGCVGGSKIAARTAIEYATERKQFGEPISNFGAIREKFANMVTGIYTLESMSYRVAGYMDETIHHIDENAPDAAQQVLAAIEEFVVEDSIMKVFGSEILSEICDETVQTLGGYGYSSEYDAERLYRDARIQRIFEGTNEINRMLVPGQILKNTMKGKLPLFKAIQKAEAAVAADKETLPTNHDAPLTRESFLTEKGKQLTVYAFYQAMQKHMADLKDQQEILLRLADLIIACYALDSTVARTQQLNPSSAGYGLKVSATSATVARYYPEILRISEELFQHLAGGDQGKLDGFYNALDRFSYRSGIDIISLQRELADAAVDKKRYPL